MALEYFLRWMGGALLVAAGAVSFGTGGGIMWRAWQDITAKTEEFKAQVERHSAFLDGAEQRLKDRGIRTHECCTRHPRRKRMKVNVSLALLALLPALIGLWILVAMVLDIAAWWVQRS